MDDGLREGTVIADKYRLVSLLGEGGMGVVWAAEHVVTKRKVALKLLRARARRGAAKDGRARERALREARASVAVADPRVLSIDDVLEHDGEAVLVMDRLFGETLRARMDREPKLPYAEVRPLLVALAEAIAAAHAKGVVHRDLKPDNVFLLAKPTPEVPLKVLDFGIAKLGAEVLDERETPLTTTGAMLGTPVYMSPEQGFGESDIDARSDAWSFGVLAYEVLAGTRPVRGENLGQVLKAIAQGSRPSLTGHTDAPPAVCHAIDALLVSDRDRRGDLAGFLAAATVATPAAASLAPPANDEALPAPAAEAEPPSPPRRRPLGLVAAFVAVGLVAAVAIADALPPHGPRAPSVGLPPAVVPAPSETAAALVAPSAPLAAEPAPPSHEDASVHHAVKSVPVRSATAPAAPPAPAPVAATGASTGRGAGGTVVAPPF